MSFISIPIASFATFSETTRKEVLSTVFGTTNSTEISEILGLGTKPLDLPTDTSGMTNFTPEQFKHFISGVSDEYTKVCRYIAEHGGMVTWNELIAELGVQRPGHFQSRMTKRARTVTKNASMRFVRWSTDRNLYYVTPTTLASMKSFFGV